MSASLKTKLLEAIKGAYPNTFSIERAEVLTKQAGYKISNYERRCRELADAGLIRAVKHQKGYIMGYLYMGPLKPVNIVMNPRQGLMFDTRPRF